MKSVKISDTLKKILSEIGFYAIISDDIDYLDIGEDENSITYTPIDKINRLIERGLDPWTNNRVSMRVGKFFNKVMFIKKAELENLVNWYKTIYFSSKGDFDKIFKIVKGEDIRYWYNQKNYVVGGGSLNASCMKGEESQNRLDLYVENPNFCSLLIMTSDDKLLSRALMWNTNNGIYIDRAYTRWDKDMILYKKYADSKKYYNYYDRNKGITLKINVGKSYEKNLPYLDSFKLDGRKLTAII